MEAGHQWYLQVIYVISPESRSGPRIQRSATPPHLLSRPRRDLVDRSGRLALDESLIYDNEGDQVKNGTNMKSLRLEAAATAPAASSFNAHVGGQVGGGVAAVVLLALALLLATCLLARRCRRKAAKKAAAAPAPEEYPLNTKVEVCLDKCMEKKFGSRQCTVRNINVLHKPKVKQVNLEVKVHNNLHDGTEV